MLKMPQILLTIFRLKHLFQVFSYDDLFAFVNVFAGQQQNLPEAEFGGATNTHFFGCITQISRNLFSPFPIPLKSYIYHCAQSLLAKKCVLNSRRMYLNMSQKALHRKGKTLPVLPILIVSSTHNNMCCSA